MRGARLEQALQQLLDQRQLPDQRVREQGLAGDGAIARDRRLHGEPLVGRHVLHEAEQFRGQRLLRQRRGAACLDPRRQLHHVVVGEPGQRAVVLHVHNVDVAARGGKRGDQPSCRLAVEGAASLLEQGGLLGQLRVGVHAEQLALDLGHLERARPAPALLGQHLIVQVEVAQVVGGNGAELVEQAPRQLDLRGDLLAVRSEQLAQHVGAVEAHGAHPGQVIETDLVNGDAFRRDRKQAGEKALQRDRDVAKTDRPMARIEERAGDDANRIGEIDDPDPVGRPRRSPLRDLEHHRNRAKRLGKAAGAGRLLADATEWEGHRFVAQARLLSADADLEEDEVGPVQRAIEIARESQSPGEALARKHPPGQPADYLEPPRIDVLQGELAHVETLALALQAGDELGRVGRAGTDDRDLHRSSVRPRGTNDNRAPRT